MNRALPYVVIFLVVFALTLAGAWFFQSKNVSPSMPTDELTKNNGSTDQGKVAVSVTLVTNENIADLAANKYDLGNNFVFYVEMNTHSVDITGVDMAKSSVLNAGTKTLTPKWEQTMESVGHHMNGFLVFKKQRNVKKLELAIRDVANVGERKFTWKL